jgi:hypothetical protein
MRAGACVDTSHACLIYRIAITSFDRKYYATGHLPEFEGAVARSELPVGILAQDLAVAHSKANMSTWRSIRKPVKMLAAVIRRQKFAVSQKCGSTKKRISYRLLEAITRVRTSCYTGRLSCEYFVTFRFVILIFSSQPRMAFCGCIRPRFKLGVFYGFSSGANLSLRETDQKASICEK